MKAGDIPAVYEKKITGGPYAPFHPSFSLHCLKDQSYIAN